MDCGFAVRLTFPTPLTGPNSLGYCSHFGLGLFAAVQESPYCPRQDTTTTSGRTMR